MLSPVDDEVLAELLKQSPAFRRYVRERAALYLSVGRERRKFDVLLAQSWWPTGWKRGEEVLKFSRPSSTQRLEDSTAWYRTLVHDGWSPVRWDHPAKGTATEVRPGEWSNELAGDARRDGSRRWQDWQLDFGPDQGRAGEVRTIDVVPSATFRVLKVMATDASPPTCCAEHAERQSAHVVGHYASGGRDSRGTATEVVDLEVGRKLVPGFGGPTARYRQVTEVGPIEISPAEQARLRVRFLRDAIFDMVAWGRVKL